MIAQGASRGKGIARGIAPEGRKIPLSRRLDSNAEPLDGAQSPDQSRDREGAVPAHMHAITRSRTEPTGNRSVRGIAPEGRQILRAKFFLPSGGYVFLQRTTAAAVGRFLAVTKTFKNLR